MKFTSMFFTASAVYLRGLSQRYIQTSEKHEVYFNVFHSECSISSRFTSKIEILCVNHKYFTIQSLQKSQTKSPCPCYLLNKPFKDRYMDKKFLTNEVGAPVADNTNSLTAGARGALLLEDNWLIEKLAHFDREVIPERRMHAKGSGAFGHFTVTNDISKYSCASLFSSVGKKTITLADEMTADEIASIVEIRFAGACAQGSVHIVPSDIELKGENTTSALDNIQIEKPKAVKVIENGRMIIIREGVRFDITGKQLH